MAELQQYFWNLGGHFVCIDRGDFVTVGFYHNYKIISILDTDLVKSMHIKLHGLILIMTWSHRVENIRSIFTKQIYVKYER